MTENKDKFIPLPQEIAKSLGVRRRKRQAKIGPIRLIDEKMIEDHKKYIYKIVKLMDKDAGDGNDDQG